MFFKISILSLLKKKFKRNSSKELQSDRDYQYWKQLFEAAKLRKNVQAKKENSDIDLFLTKYYLDDDEESQEDEDSSTSDHDESRESYEETVSWQYFDISDDSGSEASFNPDTYSTMIRNISFRDKQK